MFCSYYQDLFFASFIPIDYTDKYSYLDGLFSDNVKGKQKVHSQLKILLIEDNEADIFWLKEAFADSDTTRLVHISQHAEDALHYLFEQHQYYLRNVTLPNMILLDVNLPKKNGFELLREIKAHPQLRHIPVVIFTSSNRQEDIAKAYQEGATCYICKPSDYETYNRFLKQFEIYWTQMASLPSVDALLSE